MESCAAATDSEKTMPCYHPMQAYRARTKNKSGKRGIVFKEEDALPLSEIQLPCGQCIGCKLEKSRQWAIRCMHEASLHDDNCFITLTYDDHNRPTDMGLNKRDYQKFMKRLRFQYPEKTIRYFQCGEYGEENLRPHFHACLFNHDFNDRLIYSNKNDTPLYTSKQLEKLWTKGFSTIGDVTFDSAAYVARYVMKKITGKQADHLGKKITRTYERLDPETGEVFTVIPEYTTMSLKPGIGKDWYEKYSKDCYPSDYLIVNGKKCQPPKYYDNLYHDIDNIKKERVRRALKDRANQTPERLHVRETVKKAQISQFTRNTGE